MKDDCYKIAICDDNQADAQYVAALVKEWAGDRAAEVRLYASGESFLFHYSGAQDEDILLLDIEMGGLDGVTMAKRIRRDNETLQIVFVTGYSDYLAAGYDVAALHYLMKPVKKEQLFAVLDRAAKCLEKDARRLLLKTPEGTVVMPVREIQYLEVRQNYVTVHGKTQVTVKRTLGEFEKELDQRFFRLGRSYLVNLACIRRITKTEVLLAGGGRIPLPRGWYEALNQAVIARL